MRGSLLSHPVCWHAAGVADETPFTARNQSAIWYLHSYEIHRCDDKSKSLLQFEMRMSRVLEVKQFKNQSLLKLLSSWFCYLICKESSVWHFIMCRCQRTERNRASETTAGEYNLKRKVHGDWFESPSNSDWWLACQSTIPFCEPSATFIYICTFTHCVRIHNMSIIPDKN